MSLTMNIGPWASLIAGLLILVMPRLLNYIVAIYFIVIGLLGLFGTGKVHTTVRPAAELKVLTLDQHRNAFDPVGRAIAPRCRDA